MNANGKRDRGTSSSAENFPHALGDVVLVRWSDERIYYAKIKTINKNRQTCQVMFEDNRRGTADFDQIHAVDSVVEDWIACIVCKFGTSDSPNQIVLCDKCGVAFHQKCHQPNISDSALEPSAPWVCHFCEKGQANPHLKQTDEDTPFAEEESKPIGRRRLSSAAVNNAFCQGGQSTMTQRMQKASREAEDDRDEESCSGESTHSSRNSPRKPESPSSQVSSIGKRRQPENSDNSPSSTQPAKKKRTSPIPSTSPTRKTREETSKKAELQSLQAPVIDSQKVAAYAKWKQDKLQTTQSVEHSQIEKVVHETVQLKPKALIQTPITSAAQAAVPQPTTKAFKVIPQPQLAPKIAPKLPHQAMAVQQPSIVAVPVKVSQTAPLPRHQAVAGPQIQSMGSPGQVLYYTSQRKTTTSANSIFTDVGAVTVSAKKLSSKPDLPMASLAEQFDVHYSRLMSNLQQARSRLPKHIRVIAQGSSQANHRLHTSPPHISQLCETQDNLHSSATVMTRHNKIGSDNTHIMPAAAHHSVFHGGVVTPQSTSKYSVHQETKKYKCAGCGEHAQFVCSRCQNVWYCSRQCQEQSYMLFCQNCTAHD